MSCVNCSYCGNILKKDLTVIFTTMNSLFHFDLCTMKNSRFEETCIRQTARACFQYGNAFIPEGWIVLCLLSWPLSDIIGNNNGKPDIMTTKSNHCQHLNLFNCHLCQNIVKSIPALKDHVIKYTCFN